MPINPSLLWAIIVGGSGAALPRAGADRVIRILQLYPPKVTARTKQERKPEMDVPVSSRSPLCPCPGNPCESTGKRTQFHVFCQQARAVCRESPGRASNVSQAGPPLVGAGGHLCPPSLAREDLPGVTLRVQVHPTAQKEHFHVPGEYLAERMHSALINILLLLL